MSSKESFQLKLQDATVDVERLGELFLMNREQVGVWCGCGVGRGGVGAEDSSSSSTTSDPNKDS
jgi:hypothetical protein